MDCYQTDCVNVYLPLARISNDISVEIIATVSSFRGHVLVLIVGPPNIVNGLEIQKRKNVFLTYFHVNLFVFIHIIGHYTAWVDFVL